MVCCVRVLPPETNPFSQSFLNSALSRSIIPRPCSIRITGRPRSFWAGEARAATSTKAERSRGSINGSTAMPGGKFHRWIDTPPSGLSLWPMHLTQLFDLSLIGRAASPAVEYQDASGALQRLTFADVDQRASRMARELLDRGLRRGDRL